MKKINHKNEIILPVTCPLITSYTAYANLLSILSVNNKTEGWIFSNFVNLWAQTTITGDTPFRFSYWQLWDTCPFFTTSKIYKDFIFNEYENVIDFLISSLSLGYYVFLNYDMYYIPHTKSYMKEHSMHQLFIFGFDKNNEQFHIADFFYDSKYSFEVSSFNDVESAIISCANTDEDYKIYLYKFQDATYNFEAGMFIKNINDYLNSTYTILNYEDVLLYPEEKESMKNGEIVFGMAYYERIINVLHLQISDNIQYKDIRPFHILYDHKQIMINRLDFLKNHGLIKNFDILFKRFQDIKNCCLIIRNLYIKFLASSNKSTLNKIINILNEVKVAETIALKDLINEING